MTKNIRFDSIKLPRVTKTKEGYLRGDAVVTRTGVFEYRNADGTIRKELRHPDDVFKTDSLNTLKMIPITDDHPPVFVDASNAAKFSSGYTGENYDVLNNKDIAVTLTVTHNDLINKILVGQKPEISMGYTVDLIPEKGVFDGVDYDYRQTNIVYNHLASVPRGRAGRDARFRFDGAFASEDLIEITLKKEVLKMSDNIDSKEIELRLDAALASSREKEAKIELLRSEVQHGQLKIDAMEKANTDLKQQVDDLKAKTDAKIIAQKVMDRVSLFGLASQYIDPTAYLYHTDREIMIAAINAKQKTSDNFDGLDEGYIKGRFDALMNASIANNVNPDIFKVISHHADVAAQLSSNDMLIKHHIESQNKRN